MTARIAVLVLLVCAAIPRSASAHRLDEYLQATRIAIKADRVEVEINLTPGAAVADNVFSAIDSNRDDKISDAEGAAYAEFVIRSSSLDVDGRPYPLTLGTYSIPSLPEMRRGEGVLRLRAAAATPAATAGGHRLTFANTHRSDIGVYLINALVPSDDRIRITAQSRDVLQHEFRMDYSVSGQDRGLATVLPPLVGLTLAAGLYAAARKFS